MKIREFFDTVPPSPRLILPDFPVGSVGALTGPPGSGKTALALQLCAAVASATADGANLLNLSIRSHGPVFYFNGEDSEAELHRMVYALGNRLSPEARKAVIKDLHVDVGFGVLQDITEDECRNSVVDLCHGAALIVFDTLSAFHGLDESKRSQAARLSGVLNNIARETGAAVLCLDHPDPASVLPDRVGWRARLRPMKEEESGHLSEEAGAPPVGQSRTRIEPHRYFSELWITDGFFSNLGTVTWFKLADDMLFEPAHLYPAGRI